MPLITISTFLAIRCLAYTVAIGLLIANARADVVYQQPWDGTWGVETFVLSDAVARDPSDLHEAADDFILKGTFLITAIEWVASYYDLTSKIALATPDSLIYRVRLYRDDGGKPALTHFYESARINVRPVLVTPPSVPDGAHRFLAMLDKPIVLNANKRYWLVVQDQTETLYFDGVEVVKPSFYWWLQSLDGPSNGYYSRYHSSISQTEPWQRLDSRFWPTTNRAFTLYGFPVENSSAGSPVPGTKVLPIIFGILLDE